MKKICYACFWGILSLAFNAFGEPSYIRRFAPDEFFTGHLQGIAADESGIYWSFWDRVLKTDWQGNKIACVSSPKHAGDCTLDDGKLYISTNLETKETIQANQGMTGALLIYDCKTLKHLQTVPLKETPKPDGIVWFNDHLYIANDDYGRELHEECSICIYDRNLKFLKKVCFKTGVQMRYGIQTLNLHKGKILAGFYSKPSTFLLEPETFRVLGKFTNDVSSGFAAVPESVFKRSGIVCIGLIGGKWGKYFAKAGFYTEKAGYFGAFPINSGKSGR